MQIIQVKDRGSFFAGGHRHTLSGLPVSMVSYTPGGVASKMDPNGDYQVGQMYVQYTRLAQPRFPYPAVLCHGGGVTGVCWETTPDLRPGWDTLLLRKGYDVFVSDSVERGRASWARYPEINPGPPVFKTYQNIWVNFRFGPKYLETYEGLQFPVDFLDNLMKQNVARWTTSDDWTQQAMDEYISMMKDGCILIAHSTGCLYAARAAMKYPQNVKACILLEPAHLPDYQTEDITVLKNIPFLCLWGDYIGPDYAVKIPFVERSYYTDTPAFFEILNSAGGKADIIDLPQMGIRGNSHMLMMDRNSEQILEVALNWLEPLLK